MQHGFGFISSTRTDQGVIQKVIANKDHDSGVVTTGLALSAHGGLAVGDTLPLPDGNNISNPHMSNRKFIGTAHTICYGSNDVKIKPSKYDGNTSWMDYLSHFEMCALVNMWSEHQKGLYLAESLIGQAQVVFGDLPKEKRQIFSDLVKKCTEERFAPSSQTELYRVHIKERQKGSETLPELASEDTGMFVELSINDVPVKFVVDTGAMLTLVSTRVYDLIPGVYKSHIKSDNYLSLRELQDNIVVRRFDDRELNVVKLQAAIPMSERKQVLQYCHETKYAGHLGMHKTLEKIRRSYYWPGFQSDVREYVAGCDKCARRKTPMKRKRASVRLEEDNGRRQRKRSSLDG
ncbi:unnamed protein product [Mytilus coruscus]|uniref:Integrase zinc-binding domain-containing protein n=1 Tax=Mytilus coruscus TaxID=42192 RepID=A0A6J8EF79_MYTCO|nr:unnamed protein product [Mytilus coruscus]